MKKIILNNEYLSATNVGLYRVKRLNAILGAKNDEVAITIHEYSDKPLILYY